MVNLYSGAHEYWFKPCSTIWRAATRWRTFWKDSRPFPAVLHWKRWNKPSISYWRAPDAAGLDVLITVDRNIPDQQDLAARKIAVVILRGPTNRLRDLAPLAPAALSTLGSIGPGDVVRIG